MITFIEGGTCTSWCIDTGHPSHDPACWGDDTHQVPLSVEHGYPADADPDSPLLWAHDPPKIGVHSYRRAPGCLPTVHLWCYRPHENEHLDLDMTLHLTADEARRIAGHLIAVAEEIDGKG